MNFRQMRYAVTLAEELSFSHAARRLYISQPSLSQCIRALEEDLGAQLFDRSGGRVALTPAGGHFVERSREILALADRLKEDMARSGGADAEQLRIGVSDSGSLMAPMLLPRLQARFPNTQISFVEQPVSELEGRVLDGELDLIFTMLPTRFRDKFEITPVLRDDFLIACPRSLPGIQAWLAGLPVEPSAFDHPQTVFPALPWRQLLGFPFITVKRKRFELELSRIPAVDEDFKLNTVMEVANVITALSMVASGNGVCPVPATIIKLGTQDPRVFYCRIDELFPACELAVSYLKGTTLSAAARAYVDLLTELVHDRALDH